MQQQQDALLIGFQLGVIRSELRGVSSKCDKILEQTTPSTISTSSRPSDVVRERAKVIAMRLLRMALTYLTPYLLAAVLWAATGLMALVKWIWPIIRGWLGL